MALARLLDFKNSLDRFNSEGNYFSFSQLNIITKAYNEVPINLYKYLSFSNLKIFTTVPLRIRVFV